jgi:superfamily I DNA/RNA helicase
MHETHGVNLSWRKIDQGAGRTDDDKALTRYEAVRGGASEFRFLKDDNYNERRYRWLIAQYETFKKENNLVDFTDCLTRFRDNGRPLNVKVAFIDEAQDLTRLQWDVCRTAFANCEKIRIAGDDYQSVFTYAGAVPGTFVSLARRYQAVKLETSYRIPGAVYNLTKKLTMLISVKEEKDFAPATDYEGFVERVTDRTWLMHQILNDLKANGAQPRRWYLLVRNTCFMPDVTERLEHFVIPYHAAQGFCLQQKNLLKIKRYYNFQKRGFGTKESKENFCKRYNIKDIRDAFYESDLIPTIRRYLYAEYVDKYGIDALIEMSNKAPFVLVSTVHKTKGDEADYVALFLDHTRKTAKNMGEYQDEEMRVLYVACTRTKRGLYLVARRGWSGADRVFELLQSDMM